MLPWAALGAGSGQGGKDLKRLLITAVALGLSLAPAASAKTVQLTDGDLDEVGTFCFAWSKQGPSLACLKTAVDPTVDRIFAFTVDVPTERVGKVEALVFPKDGDRELDAQALARFNQRLSKGAYQPIKAAWSTPAVQSGAPQSASLRGRTKLAYAPNTALKLTSGGKTLKIVSLAATSRHNRSLARVYEVGGAHLAVLVHYWMDPQDGFNDVRVLGIPLATAPAAKRYPAANRKAFLDACARSSPKGLCECMLQRLEGRYTFKQFSDLEAQMVKGHKDPAFMAYIQKVAKVCAAAYQNP